MHVLGRAREGGQAGRPRRPDTGARQVRHHHRPAAPCPWCRSDPSRSRTDDDRPAIMGVHEIPEGSRTTVVVTLLVARRGVRGHRNRTGRTFGQAPPGRGSSTASGRGHHRRRCTGARCHRCTRASACARSSCRSSSAPVRRERTSSSDRPSARRRQRDRRPLGPRCPQPQDRPPRLSAAAWPVGSGRHTEEPTIRTVSQARGHGPAAVTPHAPRHPRSHGGHGVGRQRSRRRHRCQCGARRGPPDDLRHRRRPVRHHPHPGMSHRPHSTPRAGAAPDSTPAPCRHAGLTEIPLYGPESVTVPGCVDGWEALVERHANLPLADLLEPAIRIAADGFEVSVELADGLGEAPGPDRQPAVGRTPVSRRSSPRARAPRSPGRCWRPPSTAIAEHGRSGLLRGTGGSGDQRRHGRHPHRGRPRRPTGPTGSIPSASTSSGPRPGPFPPTARATSRWRPPGCSSNSACPRIRPIRPSTTPSSSATGRSPGNARRWCADPDHAPHAGRATARIPIGCGGASTASAAAPPELWPDPAPMDGGTAYFCTADADGMGVSFIQSNFHGIGTGISAGDTGVWLHNRGAGFVLDRGPSQSGWPRQAPAPHPLPHPVVRFGRASGCCWEPGEGTSSRSTSCRRRRCSCTPGWTCGEAQDVPRWSMDHAASGTVIGGPDGDAHARTHRRRPRERGHIVESGRRLPAGLGAGVDHLGSKTASSTQQPTRGSRRRQAAVD